MTTPAPDLILPQVSIKTMPDPAVEGRTLILMVFETAVTHYEALICTSENYTETVNVISAGIMRAGRDAKKPSGLVVVKGDLPDGLKNGHPRPPQRR